MNKKNHKKNIEIIKKEEHPLLIKEYVNPLLIKEYVNVKSADTHISKNLLSRVFKDESYHI